MWSNLGGNEVGNALVDILYGAWNPSGRLPYTIAKKAEDYSAHLVSGGTPEDIIDIDYTERLLIDYRWFDARNITPRFEFGFGLSYTTFEYSDLVVTPVESPVEPDEAWLVDNWENGGATPIEEGSSTALWLHSPAYRVTFDVENTGSAYGGDVRARSPTRQSLDTDGRAMAMTDTATVRAPSCRGRRATVRAQGVHEHRVGGGTDGTGEHHGVAI